MQTFDNARGSAHYSAQCSSTSHAISSASSIFSWPFAPGSGYPAVAAEHRTAEKVGDSLAAASSTTTRHARPSESLASSSVTCRRRRRASSPRLVSVAQDRCRPVIEGGTVCCGVYSECRSGATRITRHVEGASPGRTATNSVGAVDFASASSARVCSAVRTALR